MTLGLAESFNILEQSPHDLDPPAPEALPGGDEVATWVPSRYNVRARTDDGRLVLWNTFHATLTVFEREQVEAIEAILAPGGIEAREEGVIEYLSRRGFVVPEGTDELRRFHLLFGQQHYRSDLLQLILLSSEDCNFRCTYCYEKFARGTMAPWVREGIKNLVKDRLDGLRSMTVSWFGGEPLYGFAAIEDLGPFFHRVAEEHSLDFSGTMTTNGYLLRPEVAGKLLAWGINRFQITIDGPPENHDRSRPARDGSGTFSTILGHLKEMRKRREHFQVSLRVNFDQNNHPNMDHFFDIVARQFGGDSRFRLRFRPVGRWGGTNDDQLQVCGEKEREDVAVHLKREALKRGLTLVEDDDLRKLQGMRAPMVCYAARPFNFVIGATGKVMKCTVALDEDESNVVGQIDEEGRLQLDRDKLARWVEPALPQDKKCEKCVVLPLCNGVSCPLRRVRHRASPCIPLRSSFKKELRSLSGMQSITQRKVVVGGAPAHSAAV